MHTDMEMWSEVRRRVLVDGESKRSVMKRFEIHWDTLKKMLEEPEPPGYRLKRPRARPKIEAFLPVIEEILDKDGAAPRKQRHTVVRLFHRLRDEHGYTGGYTMVKRVVRERAARQREVFVPLRRPAGEAQVDFGHAEAVIGGETVKVALFVMTLPHSDALFCRAYPRECLETFLDGHRRAFEFLGGVPRRIAYDNAKTTVTKLTGPRERELTKDFARLTGHYLFAAHFCLVRRPNEKGHVENLVGYARRNFLVPVPAAAGFEELNAKLEADCRRELERTVAGEAAGTKAERLERERPSLLALPAEAFEVGRVERPKVNSPSLARFDRNDHSVPTQCAHRQATAVGGIERVRFVVGDRVVAEHKRDWGRGQTAFDPIHYLALLERKPGALDFAKPLQGWALPECPGVLRRRLEGEFGSAGTREFIKALRLLEHASPPELAAAVERTLSFGACDSTAIRLVLENRRERPVALFRLDGRPHLAAVRIAAPDLTAYRSLTAGGAS